MASAEVVHRRAERGLERLALARRRAALHADPRRARGPRSAPPSAAAAISFSWLRAGPLDGDAGAPGERDAAARARRPRAARAIAATRSGSGAQRQGGREAPRDRRAPSSQGRSPTNTGFQSRRRRRVSVPQPEREEPGAREHRRAAARRRGTRAARRAARAPGAKRRKKSTSPRPCSPTQREAAARERLGPGVRALASGGAALDAARDEPPAIVRPTPSAKAPARSSRRAEVLVRRGEPRRARERLAIGRARPRPSGPRPRARARGCCTPRTTRGSTSSALPEARDRLVEPPGVAQQQRRGCCGNRGRSRPRRSTRACSRSASATSPRLPRDHARGSASRSRCPGSLARTCAIERARPRRCGPAGAAAARAGCGASRIGGAARRRACRGTPCSAARCRRGRGRCAAARRRLSAGRNVAHAAARSSRSSSREAPRAVARLRRSAA